MKLSLQFFAITCAATCLFCVTAFAENYSVVTQQGTAGAQTSSAQTFYTKSRVTTTQRVGSRGGRLYPKTSETSNVETIVVNSDEYETDAGTQTYRSRTTSRTVPGYRAEKTGASTKTCQIDSTSLKRSNHTGKPSLSDTMQQVAYCR